MKASLFSPRSSNCKSVSQGCSCPSIHSFLFLLLLCQSSLISRITYLKFNDLAVKGLLIKLTRGTAGFFLVLFHRSFSFSGPVAERIL